MAFEPDGGTIGEDQEADGIVGQSPVAVVQTADEVAQQPQGFKHSTGVGCHNFNVPVPGEFVVDK